MTNYERGRQFEWDVRRWILAGAEAEGRTEVLVIRSAGSKTDYDLIVLSRPSASALRDYVTIQAKASGLDVGPRTMKVYDLGYRAGWDAGYLEGREGR